MKTVAVVGAGVAGLLASYILLKKGYRVKLIESSDKIGGLLGRSYSWKDCYFDYGTHFLSTTGIDWVDDFIFGENLSLTEKWQRIPMLKAGSFLSNKLNENSQFVDVRYFEESYKEFCLDFFSREYSGPVENLKDWILSRFGKELLKIYEPIIQKFYGVSTENLEPSARILPGLSRLIISNDFLTTELKKSDYFDGFLSFNDRSILEKKLMVFYPAGGVYEWLSSIFESLSSNPLFSFIGGASLKKIKLNKNINIFIDNAVLNCDGLVWSAPLNALESCLNLAPYQEDGNFVDWRSTDLYHFVFDMPFLSDCHYVYCHEHTMKTFRVTLYSNFNPGLSGFHCTVEVVRASNDNVESHFVIEKELREMKLVDGNLIHFKVSELVNGFPVNSIKKQIYKLAQYEKISSMDSRIVLTGKNASDKFFMKDVIIDVANKLREKDF